MIPIITANDRQPMISHLYNSNRPSCNGQTDRRTDRTWCMA